jgi:hypothetical protein
MEYRLHPGGFSRKDPAIHFRAFVAVFEKNLPLLMDRNPLDIARVKCRVESLIAMHAMRLDLKGNYHRYSAVNVYKRNQALINQLSDEDRIVVEKELRDSFLLLPLIAIKEELNHNNLKGAFRYIFEFLRYFPKNLVPKQIFKLMVSKRIFLPLRGLFRSIRGANLLKSDSLQ